MIGNIFMEFCKKYRKILFKFKIYTKYDRTKLWYDMVKSNNKFIKKIKNNLKKKKDKKDIKNDGMSNL